LHNDTYYKLIDDFGGYFLVVSCWGGPSGSVPFDTAIQLYDDEISLYKVNGIDSIAKLHKKIINEAELGYLDGENGRYFFSLHPRHIKDRAQLDRLEIFEVNKQP